VYPRVMSAMDLQPFVIGDVKRERHTVFCVYNDIINYKTMENENQTEERPKHRFWECIGKLKDSPITNSDYYYNLANLCDAITTLTFTAEDCIEKLGDEYKSLVEDVKGYLIQIDAINEVIREKTMNKDFVVLENLVHCCNAEGVQCE